MTMLPDGNTAPAFLRVVDRPVSARRQDAMNFALRVGTVVAQYAPDDKKNLTQSTWEYDVECVVTDGMGQPTLLTYPHCVLGSMFGSISDYFMWAPRISEKQQGTDGRPDREAILQGSLVCLLCPNGNSSQPAIIFGAAQHRGAPTADKAFGAGPLMRFQYNGLFVEINADGELVLTRRGPTKTDGQPVNAKDGKTKAELRLDKEGQVVIKTGDGKQKLVMNLNDGLVSIDADRGVEINVSQGKLKTSCGQGVELGGAAEKLIKGTTYQAAEKAFLATLSTAANLLASAGASLGANPAETAALAAAPQLSAAAAALKTAVETFKVQLENVLSQKNTTE